MISLFRPKIPKETEAIVRGEVVPIVVRVSQRARSYRLSIPHGGSPVLTLPRHGKWLDAKAFLERQGDWLVARLERSPKSAPLTPGTVIPMRGVDHLIVSTGRLRGRVEAAEGPEMVQLRVPGEPGHIARRLTDWLKKQALADLVLRVPVHAASLGVTVRAVRVRGQSTRWGSCSSLGNLSFNWRLVLAPPFVLDYVAAHEVAHLVEMNHSPAFWHTVARTCPEMAAARAWLKTHGPKLMAIGREPNG